MTDYRPIARAKAIEHSIDPLWIEAIILQESAGNPYALRMEPSYKYLYQPETFARRLRVTVATEITTQKMSWGLGQLMGALFRELGFSEPMGKAFDPYINIHYMATHLQNLSHLSFNPDDIFAMYNGGPGARQKKGSVYRNQKYVDGVNHYLQSLTIPKTLIP